MANLAAIEEPLQTYDSGIYLKLARLPLWAPRFWVGERPWTTPLAFKLLGVDVRWIVWFHFALGVACWTALAAAVARQLRASALGPVAFAAVLLFSLSSDLLLWDGNIMSESISLSLTALLIALWMWLVESWRWRTATLLMATALLWAFTRDPNAWALVMVAPVCALGVATRRTSWRHLVVGGVLVLCFVASLLGSNLASRWLVPFLDIVGQRILPDPDRVAAFGLGGHPKPASRRHLKTGQ